ncbi:unnamed protein product [Schistosoma bovis]|nr:unnamed protein product [Schistosoma bovis]CAH8438407.1 unnamed protein product [Schistosoma bovis]CAH8487025.1 unnamed protein product [Schistosoma haematobium]CAH8488382.1 unnamed protein product [Schistosoma haematobium]
MTLNTQDEYRIRKEDIELYKKIRREVEQEFMAKYEPVDYRSVTKIDFHKDVVRLPPRPEPMLHEMVKEQPVTFWTEHRDKMHGNTHYSTNRTTPFGRNAAFTTPIDQYLNSRMPCEMQVYSR